MDTLAAPPYTALSFLFFSIDHQYFTGKSSKRKKSSQEDDPAVKSTGASKTLIANNVSYSADISHVISFFKQVGDDIVDVRLNKDENSRVHSGHIEFATEEAANKAVKFHNEYLLGHRVKLESTGASSKTVLMEDLPFYTEKHDVIKFFKQAGEIVDMRFGRDNRFSRSSYVEFATEEAAKMAAKLRDLDLLGRRIQFQRPAIGTGASRTLCLKNLPFDINKSDVIKFFENVGDIADVRSHSTPGMKFPGELRMLSLQLKKLQRRQQSRYLLGRPVRLAIVRETLCVQGYDTSLGADQIRSFLENHFKTCDSIVHIDIPETRFYGGFAGVPLGTALISFPISKHCTELLI
ncbi:hypothetical protein C5167_000123 [Papaver somniferum]|uniref:RRM domain-containing protein n=1 Tax=Papaver somniferum TaxID=3469 RepID=A0A4Y7KTS5_PAPSO|nr:hypothetical protein C5167_000123 [Papaver somniferum]